MRGEGSTYRHLLRAVEKACSKDNLTILWAFGSRQALSHAWYMSNAVLHPINDFVEMKGETNTIQFKNGSRIEFRTTEQLVSGGVERWTSLNLIDFGEDNSVDWINTTGQYDYLAQEIRNAIERRKKRGRNKD